MKQEKRPSITNISEVMTAKADLAAQRLLRPYYQDRVPAGFPSPAESEPDQRLDLNEYLLRHPLASFFVRVAGDSMIGEGIFDGDLLIVDRAENARHNQIVIAIVNGEFCVKCLDIQPGRVILRSANPAYPNIELTPDDQWEIWGRVIHSIHKH